MSRETMIARIRAALGERNGAAAPRAVADRLAHPPRHPRPVFALSEGAEREARLAQALAAQGTEVIFADELAALPAAVETALRAIVPTPRLVVGDDARFSALAWPNTVAYAHWRPDDRLGDGTAALTHAWGAVAETGTLVMTSSPASPASLAFLPELHIVALARRSIFASFEDAFSGLSADLAPGRFPRAINLVSSPSRTSDIGGRSVRGAHGPRHLAVVLYGGR